MSWRLNVGGTSNEVADEREVATVLRRIFAIFSQEGSPSELTNAIFEGSNGGNDNLLSPLEKPKEIVAPEPPKPRPVWDSAVPDTVPVPVVSDESQARMDAAGPDTWVHSSADASGTVTNEPPASPASPISPPLAPIPPPLLSGSIDRNTGLIWNGVNWVAP
jgi:hypothetical protein